MFGLSGATMSTNNIAQFVTASAFQKIRDVLYHPNGFVKIHGLGNDFFVVDGRKRPYRPDKATITRLCDRHIGIGGDQLLVLEQPDDAADDVRLRIYNIDGFEAQTCLNATRCIAWLMLMESQKPRVRIATLGGTIEGYFSEEGLVTLSLPAAQFDWQSIPLAEPRDALALDLTSGPLTAQAAASLGNPHLVCFVDDFAAIDVPRWAPALQDHPLLKEGANVGVAQILDDQTMKLVVWERPGILTTACGSGACAALVLARRLGLVTTRKMAVQMPGGTLVVEEGDDGTIFLSGPVEVVFLGLLP